MLYNIIFDFDGTLFDTETVDVAAINMALKGFGKDVLESKEILSYIGLPLYKIASKCLKTDNKEQINRFCKQVIDGELLLIPRCGQMYPFAINLLDTLLQKGHKLAICSNGSKAYILKLIEHFALRRYFKMIWYKRYGFSKKRGAEIVFDKFRNARKTIFIGDREEDVVVAKKNGFISIGISYGFGSENELHNADYIAKDIKQLNKIINDLEEIKI